MDGDVIRAWSLEVSKSTNDELHVHYLLYQQQS
jgi:hypothetical protein